MIKKYFIYTHLDWNFDGDRNFLDHGVRVRYVHFVRHMDDLFVRHVDDLFGKVELEMIIFQARKFAALLAYPTFSTGYGTLTSFSMTISLILACSWWWP